VSQVQDKKYLVTEADVKAIMRLSDAANLLSVGLPPEYTTTPLGKLANLVADVSSVTFTRFIVPHTCTPDR